MTLPMAFRATYADWKLIKTRGVVQVVMEVPLADSDAAYDVLGGMPNPAHETWFGIAPLKNGKEVDQAPAIQEIPATPRQLDKPAGAKRDWREIDPTTQAGMRCSEAIFQAFLKEEHPTEWRESREDSAECVRLICAVQSRKQFNTDHRARVLWHQLDTAYLAWKALEHA